MVWSDSPYGCTPWLIRYSEVGIINADDRSYFVPDKKIICTGLIEIFVFLQLENMWKDLERPAC